MDQFLLVVILAVTGISSGIEVFKSGSHYEYDFVTTSLVKPNDVKDSSGSGYSYVGRLHVQTNEADTSQLKMQMEITRVYLRHGKKSDKPQDKSHETRHRWHGHHYHHHEHHLSDDDTPSSEHPHHHNHQHDANHHKFEGDYGNRVTLVDLTTPEFSQLVRELQKPFLVILGPKQTIESFEAEEGDTWANNMKKALASYLQVPVDERTPYSKISEKFFYQPIETTYAMKKKRNAIHVYVQRNANKFEDRKYYFAYDVMGTKCSCRTGDCQRELYDNPIKGKLIIRSKTQDLEHAEFKQVITSRPYGPFGYSFSSETSFRLHLNKTYAITTPIRVQGRREEFKLVDTLLEHINQEFNPRIPSKINMFKEPSQDLSVVYNKAVELIRQGGENLDTQNNDNTKNVLLNLSHYLESLNVDYLENIYQNFQSQDKQMRLFLNTLTLTRSGHATVILYKVATSTNRKHAAMVGSKELTSQISRLMHPDKVLLQHIYTYLNNFAAGEGFEAIGKQSSLYLPFSILVSRVCQKDCPDDDPLIAQIETDVMDKIQKHKDDPLGGLFTDVLKNMLRKRSSSFFKELLSNNYSYDIKSPALWGLIGEFYQNPDEIRQIMMRIIYDKTHSFGFRMEALSFVLVTDTYETIYSLMTSMDNHDMISYAWSFLDSEAKASPFCNSQHDVAKKIMENVPRPDVEENYGSFVKQFQYYDVRHDYGTIATLNIIQSEFSIVPQKLYGRLEAKSGGRRTKSFGILINIHNTESILFSQKIYPSEDKIEFAPKEENMKFEVKLLIGHQVFMRFFVDHTMKNDVFSLEMIDKFIMSQMSTMEIFDDLRSEYYVYNALAQPTGVSTQNPTMILDKSSMGDFPANFILGQRGVYYMSKSMYLFNPLLDILQGSTQMSTLKVNVVFDIAVVTGAEPTLTIKFNPDDRILIDTESLTLNFLTGTTIPFDSAGSKYLKSKGIKAIEPIASQQPMCKHHKSSGTHVFTVRAPCMFGMDLKTFITHVGRIYFGDSTNNNEALGTVFAGVTRIIDYLSVMPDKEKVTMKLERVPMLKKMVLKYLGHKVERKGGHIHHSNLAETTISMENDQTITNRIRLEYGFGPKLLENYGRLKITKDAFGKTSEVCLNVHVHYGPTNDLLNVPENDNRAKANYKLQFGPTCDAPGASLLSAELIGTIPMKQRKTYEIPLKDITEKDRIDVHQTQTVYDQKLSFDEIMDLCKSDISYLPVKDHIPVTKFCYRPMYEASLLSDQMVTVTYRKLPPVFLELGDKLFSLIKVAYMPYWSKSADISGKVTNFSEKGSGMFVVNRSGSLENKTASYKFNFPHSTYRFSNIPFAHLPFLVMRSGRFPNLHRSYIRKNVMGSCDVNIHRANIMESFVIPHNMTSCPTVVSKDCSGKNVFTVRARKIDHPTFQMEVGLDLNKYGKTLEIKPAEPGTGSKFLITVREQRKAPRKLMESEYPEYGVYVFDHSLIIDNLLSHGVMIGFDGVFLPVGVTTFHKGSVCGLCGEFRGRTGDILAPPMNNWAHKHQNFEDQLAFSSEVTNLWQEKC